VTTSRGLEDLLTSELDEIGLKATAVPGGSTFRGSISDGMRAALWTRIGMHVLMQIGRADVTCGDDLYAAVRRLPLDDWFDADSTIAVYSRISDSQFNDSRFVGQKSKDAIVDAMRDRYGRRPDVAPKDPDIGVTIHIKGTTGRFYLDLAGDSLHKRGYRVRSVDAPAKENVAAALVRFSGWNRKKPLHDPTCGSGTIAIEAALMALDAAPALGRSMGFERWPAFGHFESQWKTLVEEARERRKPKLRAAIIASDTDQEAVNATKANCAAAGLRGSIAVRNADAREAPPLLGGGYWILNPPSGERIGGENDDVGQLNEELADRLLGVEGHTTAILSLQRWFEGGFGGIETPEYVDCLNGKLRCRMGVFEGPETFE
jgi:putative N6-adenine-specific DNA methylase